MKMLFYDIETTGLPVWEAGCDDSRQPHIVQLAGLVLASDRAVVDRMCVIVRPDGYVIPKTASDVHGITTVQAEREGIPLWKALWQFERLVHTAALRVAHNVKFDDLILGVAYHRLGVDDWPLKEQPTYCTQDASTPICKLPGQCGDYKWPKLAEAYSCLVGGSFSNAHNAMADLQACVEVYYAILALKEKRA